MFGHLLLLTGGWWARTMIQICHFCAAYLLGTYGRLVDRWSLPSSCRSMIQICHFCAACIVHVTKYKAENGEVIDVREQE